MATGPDTRENLPTKLKISSGRPLGCGSFAVVHRGTWEGRPCAVKVLLPQHANRSHQPETPDCPAAMLKREGDLLIQYPHRFLARCFANLELPPGFPGLLPGYKRSTQALVLELLEHGSLRSLLQRQLVTPWIPLYDNRTALSWAIQVASAVAHLHGLSPAVLHRDIKVENVMLKRIDQGERSSKRTASSETKPLVAKLVDLGLHVVPARVPQHRRQHQLFRASKATSRPSTSTPDAWPLQSPFACVSAAETSMNKSRDGRPSPGFMRATYPGGDGTATITTTTGGDTSGRILKRCITAPGRNGWEVKVAANATSGQGVCSGGGISSSESSPLFFAQVAGSNRMLQIDPRSPGLRNRDAALILAGVESASRQQDFPEESGANGKNGAVSSAVVLPISNRDFSRPTSSGSGWLLQDAGGLNGDGKSPPMSPSLPGIAWQGKDQLHGAHGSALNRQVLAPKPQTAVVAPPSLEPSSPTSRPPMPAAHANKQYECMDGSGASLHPLPSQCRETSQPLLLTAASVPQQAASALPLQRLPSLSQVPRPAGVASVAVPGGPSTYTSEEPGNIAVLTEASGVSFTQSTAILSDLAPSASRRLFQSETYMPRSTTSANSCLVSFPSRNASGCGEPTETEPLQTAPTLSVSCFIQLPNEAEKGRGSDGIELAAELHSSGGCGGGGGGDAAAITTESKTRQIHDFHSYLDNNNKVGHLPDISCQARTSGRVVIGVSHVAAFNPSVSVPVPSTPDCTTTGASAPALPIAAVARAAVEVTQLQGLPSEVSALGTEGLPRNGLTAVSRFDGFRFSTHLVIEHRAAGTSGETDGQTGRTPPPSLSQLSQLSQLPPAPPPVRYASAPPQPSSNTSHIEVTITEGRSEPLTSDEGSNSTTKMAGVSVITAVTAEAEAAGVEASVSLPSPSPSPSPSPPSPSSSSPSPSPPSPSSSSSSSPPPSPSPSPSSSSSSPSPSPSPSPYGTEKHECSGIAGRRTSENVMVMVAGDICDSGDQRDEPETGRQQPLSTLSDPPPLLPWTSNSNFTQALPYESFWVLEVESVYRLTGATGSYITMAPEVYQNLPYNEKADVFSFGVFLYELLSRSLLSVTHLRGACGTGLPNSPRKPEQYAEAVSQGYRPCRVASIPDPIWQLIRECWDQDPFVRPTMPHVLLRLQAINEEMETAASLTTGRVSRGNFEYGSGGGGMANLSSGRKILCPRSPRVHLESPSCLNCIIS